MPPLAVPSVTVPLPSTSTLPYPLEVTRTYLLGQLEYYLSPQNLAQDFFLRQRQMDNEGWILIALLASFKRVQQLTTDMDLVRDVLSMSSLAEVWGDWVRMAGRLWEPFVLPNAPKSVTEAEGDVEDCEVDGEEDDDEDIVFVIGEEAEGSWMPERKQP
ncbi:winged helix DNA-binding domain-containing protein [Melanogaster broomeanus]|nr:winged helix DNA-binding domain-containing protein [Melanogaster broomeanus]